MGIKAPLSLCLRPIFRCEWAAGWGEAPGRQGPQVAEGQNPWPGGLWTGGHTPGHRPERLGAPVHRFLSPEPRGNPAEGIGLHQPGQASQPLSSTWVGGKPTDWTPSTYPMLRSSQGAGGGTPTPCPKYPGSRAPAVPSGREQPRQHKAWSGGTQGKAQALGSGGHELPLSLLSLGCHPRPT